MHLAPDPAAPAAPTIDFDAFLAPDIRVGRVVSAALFEQARAPSMLLDIDFGPVLGILRSSARIVRHHPAESLPGKLVLAVVNLPPRQIGPRISRVLTLGVPDADGEVVLVTPMRDDVPLGGRLF